MYLFLRSPSSQFDSPGVSRKTSFLVKRLCFWGERCILFPLKMIPMSGDWNWGLPSCMVLLFSQLACVLHPGWVSYRKAEGSLCVSVQAAWHAYICIIHVYLCNIHLQHMWANCFFDAPFQAFCLKSPCVLAINLKNAASALCLAPWLLREGMLFGVLVTRTSFRGVYAARLTPSEVVLVVRGIPALYTSLFPENKEIF